jgi:hypothetical protein
VLGCSDGFNLAQRSFSERPFGSSEQYEIAKRASSVAIAATKSSYDRYYVKKAIEAQSALQ